MSRLLPLLRFASIQNAFSNQAVVAQTRKSLELQIEPTSPPQINLPSININLAKILRQYMQSTLHVGRGIVSSASLHGVQAQFTIAMDDAYSYRIGATNFDPDIIFREIITLRN
ncbi:hypothetical protein N7448_000970 [Penicillium atrosanguineum]|uniref:Uncharacterized protein n=1 Tax=Penicillium atrosanguineum TaxID=1132637 RepID=A0A9W9Q8D8_9EURO|nr:uncharacterized protein N7443_004366 [Penicillium atrosanguineum]KAJ5134009.1 hypothetical protein N7526_005374 [Penicillium atrosanguineum]KAJ5149392.1 hypothetical protein N7448_000970 [Penicillium atrosanguineum]KAJ5304706.1 hypothetical protein N7443_004366 [Penicillium atrosanguineum]KAJ5324171.1 hypothetical protein N7476_002771 [Penicillium atrosanguineum]